MLSISIKRKFNFDDSQQRCVKAPKYEFLDSWGAQQAIIYPHATEVKDYKKKLVQYKSEIRNCVGRKRKLNCLIEHYDENHTSYNNNTEVLDSVWQKMKKLKVRKGKQQGRPKSLDVKEQNDTQIEASSTKFNDDQATPEYNAFNYWKSPVMDLDDDMLLGYLSPSKNENMDIEAERSQENHKNFDSNSKYNSFNYWRDPIPALSYLDAVSDA